MCYGGERLPSKEDFDVNGPTRPTTAAARLAAVNENEAVVENLRDRLAETEARLERARAREAELSRQLEEMKRFVSVMEILETYLKRRYREQQDQLCRLFSPGCSYPVNWMGIDREPLCLVGEGGFL
ncbi:protein SKIP34 isoform X1 [Coffea eugenioides]|uniref:protein SKIP34 isoform X1 n=1 Tax=Coffea eugenioides TaxID=49369 RepID=UPI000F5D394C|nr:protein SKIP34-like [Coffea arabica]XP_027178826.1 protein SKIP34 isoform X1 [Coffea eugenioides]